MNREMRTVGVIVLAVSLAATACWGVSPQDGCEAAKNQEAGKYAFCRAKAEAKAIKRGVAADYSKCDAKFLGKWTKAELVAIAKGGACIDSVISSAMQSFVSSQTDAVAGALDGGVLPVDAETCESDLTTCEANLVACGDEVTSCNAAFGACSGNLATCAGDVDTAQTALTVCNSNFGTCSGNLTTCSTSLGTAQSGLAGCNTNAATCAGSLTTCTSNLGTTQVNLTACNGNLSTCSGDLATCSNDLNMAQSVLTVCNATLGTCESDLPLAQSSLDACIIDLGTCDANFATCQSGLNEAESAVTACGANLTTCQSALPQAQAELAVCDTDLAACADELATCPDDLAACELALTGFPGQLLRTGQSQCWDSSYMPVPCTGTGQDAEALAGLALSFTDNGDGTITDNSTGLMWEKLSDDGSIHQYDFEYAWDDAGNKISALNSGSGFAGYTDWRLPNIKELQSLANYGTTNPAAVHEPFDTDCAPLCTVLTCSCTEASLYWSSTTFQGTPEGAWRVNFLSGAVGGNTKVSGSAVRAVRTAS